MRNVGAKRINIHQNQHGSRSKCAYMTKIVKKMSCILQITGNFLSNCCKIKCYKPEMSSVIAHICETIGQYGGLRLSLVASPIILKVEDRLTCMSKLSSLS